MVAGPAAEVATTTDVLLSIVPDAEAIEDVIGPGGARPKLP